MKSSKEAAKKLIQSVDFASGGQIGIVTFSSNDRYDNAQYLKVSRNKKYATNKTEAEMLKVRNLGKKSFDEVTNKLHSLGLDFAEEE